MRKVVITGIGVVSPIGADRDAFWDSLVEGRSGIGPITKVDTAELRFKNAAEVKGFDASSHFDERQMMMLDPFAHFGIVAAREAISDAGFVADEKIMLEGYFGFVIYYIDIRCIAEHS